MQLPIPDDWNGEDTCRYAVCWPKSPKWLAVLMGLIESPMQGRLWDFTTGNFLTLREQFRTIYEYNFNLEGVIMACNDTGLQEIAIAMENIATALGQLNINQTVNVSGGSSGGCECEQTVINQNGGVIGYLPNGDGTNTPYYGTEQSIGIPTGEYPEGYQSLNDYEVSKCELANLIVDGLIGTVRAFGMLTGAELGASLGALIVSLVLPSLLFPPAAVAVVCIAIGVGGAIFSILLQVAIYINTNREDWVCALYQGESTDEILQVISALIETMITALTIIAPFAFAVKTIILTLLSTDTLNQLFRLTAHIQYAGADCSGCVESLCDFEWDFEEGQGDWASEVLDSSGGTPTLSWADGTLNFLVDKTSGNNSSGVWSYAWEEGLGPVGAPTSTISLRLYQLAVCAAGCNIFVISSDPLLSFNHYIDISANAETYADPGAIVTIELNAYDTWGVTGEIIGIGVELHSGSNCGTGQTNIGFDDVCLTL